MGGLVDALKRVLGRQRPDAAVLRADAPLWLPRAMLGLTMLGFLIVKLPYLNLPFYWDEAWVYAPAVKAMRASGISLLPWAIPPELTRGHPLLFHAVGAAWMTLFDGSFSALHALPLFISLVLHIAVYRAVARVGGELLGACAALLLAANEMLLAQSGLLLPETLLALLMVLASSAYIARRPWPYLAWTFLALWTKETAIVLVLALVLTHAFAGFNSAEWPGRKAWWKWLALLPAPALLASTYFILQRWKLGWFFFPEHMGMITWTVLDIGYKAREAFRVAFEEQGLQWLTLGGAVAAPLLMARKHPALGVGSALAFVAAIKVLWGRWPVPDAVQLPVVLACLALGVALLGLLVLRVDGQRSSLIVLSGLTCIGLWAFSALNFYTPRYLLPIAPFLTIGALAALQASAPGRWRWAMPLATAVIAAHMAASIGKDGHVGDSRLSYRDAIAIHQERIRYCEDRGLQQAVICASFIDVHYMTHPDAGYLTGDAVFTKCSAELLPTTEFAFVDYQSRKELPAELEALGFSRAASFKRGLAWGEIYARR